MLIECTYLTSQIQPFMSILKIGAHRFNLNFRQHNSWETNHFQLPKHNEKLLKQSREVIN